MKRIMSSSCCILGLNGTWKVQYTRCEWTEEHEPLLRSSTRQEPVLPAFMAFLGQSVYPHGCVLAASQIHRTLNRGLSLPGAQFRPRTLSWSGISAASTPAKYVIAPLVGGAWDSAVDVIDFAFPSGPPNSVHGGV